MSGRKGVGVQMDLSDVLPLHDFCMVLPPHFLYHVPAMLHTLLTELPHKVRPAGLLWSPLPPPPPLPDPFPLLPIMKLRYALKLKGTTCPRHSKNALR